MWLPAMWWSRPSSNDESSFLATCQEFNYEKNYVGLTAEAPFSNDRLDQLKKEGFFVNHSRVKIGSGIQTFNKGKDKLQRWGHLQLGSVLVDPITPIKVGTKFGIHVHELVAWLINPLQIVYVTQVNDNCDGESSPPKLVNTPGTSAFAFGSGTLKGHLLAGEERFAVEWNREDDTVWYEILSFSKPANFLSVAGLPVVRFQQHQFAKHSSNVMVRAMNSDVS